MKAAGAHGFSQRRVAVPLTTGGAAPGSATFPSTTYPTWSARSTRPAVGRPADLVLAQLALDEALQAIRGLPPLQAEVLVLRIVAGLSTETVAALTGSTPGAVRVAAHRGLKRLAGQFTPAGAARV